jgi:hypothetical protein
MALPETLYHVLSQPVDASRVKQLRTVHEAIKASLSGHQPGSRVGLETLVVCAEAALKVRAGCRAEGRTLVNHGSRAPGP